MRTRPQRKRGATCQGGGATKNYNDCIQCRADDEFGDFEDISKKSMRKC